MTDQPLPLKPWYTEMDDELETILADHFDPLENWSENWLENWSLGVQAVYAYCWKLLSEKDSEIRSLRQGKQVAQEAVLAQVEKVKELEAEIIQQGHTSCRAEVGQLRYRIHDLTNGMKLSCAEHHAKIQELQDEISGCGNHLSSEFRNEQTKKIQEQAETIKMLTEALVGTITTLARYHDKIESYYIDHDDPEQRCEGCGTIEYARQALDRVKGK